MAANKSENNQAARVRFAPSPTGLTHLGSARTALYNYLLARQTGGQFILRIEDTDRKRYDPQAEQDLIDSLHWLGLQWDEGPDVGGDYGPYRQSERLERYQEYAEQLIESGHAFYCFCTADELEAHRKAQKKKGEKPRYASTCRHIPLAEAQQRVAAGEQHVVRFKMPYEGSITVHDELRGDIQFNNKELDDSILVKSDGFAVYHLAAMVDDHLMDITHVFRGEEWIPSFPLHAHIYRALGWREPKWVHLSVFLSPTGRGKMSKRETEALRLTGQTIFIKDMQQLGYLPEAVTNWVALMGWSYDDKTEFFTLEDLVEKFSLAKLNPANAAIDFKKLDHFNGLHIRSLSVTELAKRLVLYFQAVGIDATYEDLLPIAPLIQPRLVTLDEGPEWAAFLFKDEIELVAEDLLPKGMDVSGTLALAEAVRELMAEVDDYSHEKAEAPLRQLAKEMGLKAGQLFGFLRAATSGQKVSPPLLESMQIIGRGKVLRRLDQAIHVLKQTE